MADLRPYQNEAIAAACATLETERSALVVLPTGCGKTVVFAKLAEIFSKRGRVLVLAHREELIRQAVEKIQAWTPLRCEVEMANERAHLDGLYPPDVVVASVQSLARERRLARFTEFDFSLVVVDEAHHATASTYRAITDYFQHAVVLGVTATPDRGDREALGQVFGDIAYVYEMRTAIDEGYLVPIRQKAVEVEGLDLSKVRTTAGDLNEKDLAALLRRDEQLHHVAEPVVELAAGRKTLIFAVTVEHAHDLARVITGYGAGVAEALDGSADPLTRKKTIERFSKGDTNYLVNCALFTEGFDLPAISCVAVARPTKSRALYAQMVGRGTRLSPETGKTDCMVIDFRGNAGKHTLSCPIDILGGKVSEEAKKRAEQILAGRGDMSISAAVDEAERQLDAEKAALIEKERKREEKAAIRVGVKKSVREVDPFSAIGMAPRARTGGAPSADQLQQLEALGFPATSKAWSLDSASAQDLIRDLHARAIDGRCSFKQAALLKRYGLNPNVSKAEASRAIKTIIANNWQVPERLREVMG